MERRCGEPTPEATETSGEEHGLLLENAGLGAEDERDRI
jgi:hypothetical protein